MASCDSCGAILRSNANRGASEPAHLCAPCQRKAEDAVSLAELEDCPLCHEAICGCDVDGHYEDTGYLADLSAEAIAKAHHPSPCTCENPTVQHTEDGNRCLNGHWVDV